MPCPLGGVLLAVLEGRPGRKCQKQMNLQTTACAQYAGLFDLPSDVCVAPTSPASHLNARRRAALQPAQVCWHGHQLQSMRLPGWRAGKLLGLAAVQCGAVGGLSWVGANCRYTCAPLRLAPLSSFHKAGEGMRG